MLSTTLTNNRVINGAVVRYKIENNYYLTIQIEANHLIALDTYCKINITGLNIVNDFKDYNSGNVLTDIFNGTKAFKAISNTILEAVINIGYYYSPVFFEVISGTPVVTTANPSWIINVSNATRFNFQLIKSNIVNFNTAKIEIIPFKNNGTEMISDVYDDGSGANYSLHEQNLDFTTYDYFTLSLKDSPSSATNIPIIITHIL